MPSTSPAPAFRLQSPETGTTYSIYAALPDEAREPGPWPCVLFMDGDDQFRYALDAYHQARKAGEVQPLAMVGVGYGASYTQPGNRRVRDYTPTPLATETDSGQARAFTAFLTGTLWPELVRRYRLSEEERGLAGHSLGSLLAVAAAFDGSGFFTRILASAPSLWWDERSVFAQVRASHARDSRLKGRLFLSVGLEDSPSMTGDLALFESLLRETPFEGLEVTQRHFAGKDHYNVLPLAFRTGLGALYGPVRPGQVRPHA